MWKRSREQIAFTFFLCVRVASARSILRPFGSGRDASLLCAAVRVHSRRRFSLFFRFVFLLLGDVRKRVFTCYDRHPDIPPSPLSPGRYATFCRTSSLPRTLEVASVADFRSFPFFAFLYLIYQPLFALINRRSLVEKPKTTEVFSLLF